MHLRQTSRGASAEPAWQAKAAHGPENPSGHIHATVYIEGRP
jgi:hypothetical protein